MCGLLDEDGKILIPFDYKDISYDDLGFILVTTPDNEIGFMKEFNQLFQPLAAPVNNPMHGFSETYVISPQTGQVISIIANTGVPLGQFMFDPNDPAAPNLMSITGFGDAQTYAWYGIMYAAGYEGKHVVIYFGADNAAAKSVVLTIGKLTYTCGGVESQLDVAPYIDAACARTMVPIRFIAEGLGADVEWDDSVKTDTIVLGGKTLAIKVGAPLPNGMGSAVLVNDRLFVPVRYIAEQLGANVDWDGVGQIVTITL